MIYAILTILMILWIVLILLFIYEIHLLDNDIHKALRKLDRIMRSIREEN